MNLLDENFLFTGYEGLKVRTFDYSKLARELWDTEILSYVSRIHEYRGRQKMLLSCKPDELTRLEDIARIQSTESSNKIEGIVTTDARMKQLFEDKTTPRNRDEDEIIGYRDVLKTIHENYEFIPLRPSYILQLHRDLLKLSGVSYAGHFKNVQNFINETGTDGTTVTRFIPVPPYETPDAVEAACSSFTMTLAQENIDPLILIPVFICDFLCIHPFNDGNGRMSRLLTLLLLYQSGYKVGKYISIERKIEITKDAYYEALKLSDQGWHEEKNDPVPFIKYMLKIILACYVELEERVGHDVKGSAGTAYEVVKDYVRGRTGKFTGAQVAEACPSAGRSSVLSALKKLTEEGMITRMGSGRGTCYIRIEEEVR